MSRAELLRRRYEWFYFWLNSLNKVFGKSKVILFYDLYILVFTLTDFLKPSALQIHLCSTARPSQMTELLTRALRGRPATLRRKTLIACRFNDLKYLATVLFVAMQPCRLFIAITLALDFQDKAGVHLWRSLFNQNMQVS